MNEAPTPGWRFVWGLSAAQLVSWGSLYYAFSVFLTPMGAELGWSKTELTGALSLGLLTAAAAALPVGLLIDRGRARLVMAGGSLAGALLLVAWSQNASLAAFYAIYLALGVVLAMTLYDPAFAVLNTLMGFRARRAIMAMTLVGGFASSIFFPLSQALIDALGWRPALLVLAALNLAAALAHALLLQGVAPPPRPASAPAPLAPSPLRAALGRRTFWGLLLAHCCNNAVFAVTSFHLIPLLIERGFSAAGAVLAASLIGPMQVAGRVVVVAHEYKGGAGRLGSAGPVGGSALVLSLAGAALLLVLEPGSWLIALFALLYGAGNGIMSIVRGTAVPELIGREGVGAIAGAIAAAANVARALAPVMAAVIWSAFGGYEAVIWALIGLSVLALSAFALALKPGAGNGGGR
jgi:MFS family permease